MKKKIVVIVVVDGMMMPCHARDEQAELFWALLSYSDEMKVFLVGEGRSKQVIWICL